MVAVRKPLLIQSSAHAVSSSGLRRTQRSRVGRDADTVARSAAHPFYAQLNQLLDQHDFDGYVERLASDSTQTRADRSCRVVRISSTQLSTSVLVPRSSKHLKPSRFSRLSGLVSMVLLRTAERATGGLVSFAGWRF